MYKEPDYRYLFVFSKEYEGYNRYWSMYGNYDQKSIDYRLPNSSMRIKYNTTDLEELTVIECKDFAEAVHLQRSMNEIFKLWENGDGSSIKIDMKPETFIYCLKTIYKIMYDNNKMLELFKFIAYEYKRYNKWSGEVYFVKCANNKLKIGETSDMVNRWGDLKSEDQNKAIDIIDVISVSDRKYVEAELHLLCRGYKTDGNKVRTNSIASTKLGELFIDCNEVINIWNNYWERYKGFNSKISERRLNYIRTGDWHDMDEETNNV